MTQRPKNELAVLLAAGKGTAEERARAARLLGHRAWDLRTRKEKARIIEHLAAISNGRPPDKSQPRCPCGRMTLKRAKARGFTRKGHLESCHFHAV